MTERGPLYDQDEPPEDVATLYSWANLHGAKYRDFSAARAQTREKARLRVLQAIEDEKARALQQGGVEPPLEVQNLDAQSPIALNAKVQDLDEMEQAVEVRRAAEIARAQEQARLADLAAQEATNLAVQQAAQEAAQRAARMAAEQAAQQATEHAAHQAAQLAELQAARHAAEQAAQQMAAQQMAAQQLAEQHMAEQRAAQEAELHATRLAAEQAAQQLAAQRASQQSQAMQDAAQRSSELQAARKAAEQAAQQLAAHRAAQEAAQRAWHPPLADRFSTPQAAEPAPPTSYPAAPHFPLKPEYPAYAQPQARAPIQNQPQPAASREESYQRPRNPWSPADQHEPAGRPAWLTPDRAEVTSQTAVPPAPEDTLQGSRDRLTSRWYALRGVFEGTGAPAEAAPAPAPARAPVVAIFSLAGGVGKTSLVATLGRALSARGERVLLVDTAPYGLLPFFFGARDQRPGLLRTFSPPGNSGDAPIQMVTIDPEGMGPETTTQDPLTAEIGTYSRGVSRVIVDLATASGATTRRVLRLAPLVLVPLIPDMNSVVSFSSIDSFFQHNGNPAAKPSLPYYVLNQFDPSLPLHLDIREVLREQLGDRLLPFVLRRAPAVSEALAEGMTVMDYAPNSTVAEDFGGLAGWVKSQSAPASSTYRGVRWSER
jgi:cellulose synthase operon protein YhjQ